ncbi:MAG: hypothetical protein V4684_09355 [Pseudomonadota bacterium]
MSPRNGKPGVLQQQPRRITDAQKQQQAGSYPPQGHGGCQLDADFQSGARPAATRDTNASEAH